MARNPGRREVTPNDLPLGQRPPIDLSPAGMLNREPEQIIPVEKAMASDDFDELAFMEEEVLIRLEHSTDRHQPMFKDFGVNGRTEWVPVGKPHKIKRKFLEVILRSQPFNVQTDVGDATVERPHNHIVRHQSSKYPCSILRDPNPRGADWAMRVSAGS